MSALLDAARAGDADAIARALDAGALIEERSKSGRTALHLAAQNRKYAAVKLLLSRGASVRGTAHDGNTPFIDTVAWHDTTPEATELLQILLDAGSDINEESADGWTALMTICPNDKRYNELVRFLVARGAALNHQSKDGWTPLMLASHDRRFGGWDGPAAVLLSSKGIDVNCRGLSFGWTPLLIAAKTSSFQMCELLLRHGADRDVTLCIAPGKYTPKAATHAQNLHRAINTTRRFHGFNAVQLAEHHKRGAVAESIAAWGA